MPEQDIFTAYLRVEGVPETLVEDKMIKHRIYCEGSGSFRSTLLEHPSDTVGVGVKMFALSRQPKTYGANIGEYINFEPR